jgi:hypothetical protein
MELTPNSRKALSLWREVAYFNLLDSHSLVDNPQVKQVFDLAWEFGHGNGESEINYYFQRMLPLVVQL